MKKRFLLPLIALGALVLLVGSGVAFLRFARPNVPLVDLHVDVTPERLARGKYLGEHVAACIDCHSARDWSRFSGPMVSGSEGQGGETFTPEMGLPGTFISPNITPHALSGWTDAEIYRAITSGVSKDGRPLFPLMPWMAYAKMDREDALSLVAWVRSLAPRTNEPAKSSPAFPISLIMRTFPAPAAHQARPATNAPSAERGKYLAAMASCVDCHSPVDKGQIIPGREFTGGREFPMGKAMVRSANLTPDATGLGAWTKETFLARFAMYRDAAKLAKVKEGETQSIMPWNLYAGMSEEDLSAIWDYLRTLPAKPNAVKTFTAL